MLSISIAIKRQLTSIECSLTSDWFQCFSLRIEWSLICSATLSTNQSRTEQSTSSATTLLMSNVQRRCWSSHTLRTLQSYLTQFADKIIATLVIKIILRSKMMWTYWIKLILVEPNVLLFDEVVVAIRRFWFFVLRTSVEIQVIPGPGQDLASWHHGNRTKERVLKRAAINKTELLLYQERQGQCLAPTLRQIRDLEIIYTIHLKR